MSKKYSRYALILVLLAIPALACNLFSIGNQIKQIKAAVTDVQALATEGGQLLVTAQAYTTQNPGMVETAQAGIGAIATENPGILNTMEAQIPGGTASAGTGDLSQVPADYPMPDPSLIKNLNVIQGVMVTFNTPQDLKTVNDFYAAQLVAKGWTKTMDLLTTGQMVTTQYTKDTRTLQLVLIYDASAKSTNVSLVSESK